MEETRALVPRGSFQLSGLGPECGVGVSGIRFAALLPPSASSRWKVTVESQHLCLSQLPLWIFGAHTAAPWVARGRSVPESRLPLWREVLSDE